MKRSHIRSHADTGVPVADGDADEEKSGGACVGIDDGRGLAAAGVVDKTVRSPTRV
jgi:hypothetical protein